MWHAAFLAALATTGNISAAARAAGIDRATAHRAHAAEPAFAARWAEALDEAADALELEARRRAHDGLRRLKFHAGALLMAPVLDATGRPVLGKGGQAELVPYVEHEYSDLLLIFLLRACRPEVYRERHDLKVEGNVTLDLVETVCRTREEAQAAAALMAKAARVP